MELEFEGANDITLKELEDLFNDDVEQEQSPTANGTTNPDSSDEQKDVSQTKAFAKRLAEEKTKVANEEREKIAKELGYNSYQELQLSKEKKLYEEKGLDHDEISPLVNQLVEEKLNSDPRMKELEQFRSRQVEEFAKRELEEITKLTGGEITDLKQIPQEVIELWKKKGSLKSAYLELKGEELILKARSAQSKGSTSHLNQPSGSSAGAETKRHLTAKEREMWKFFNPSLTDEELDKKLVDK